MTSLSSSKELLATIESVMKCLALLLGGSWAVYEFIRKRERLPRARLKQEVTDWKFDDNRCLLRVSLIVENISQILLQPQQMFCRLQQVSPPELEDFDRAEGDMKDANSPERPWRLITERKLEFKKGEREIEPGEQDEFHFDFVLSDHIERIIVYCYIANAAKNRTIGWNVTSVYRISVSPSLSDGENEI